jgi:hypothetical protein
MYLSKTRRLMLRGRHLYRRPSGARACIGSTAAPRSQGHKLVLSLMNIDRRIPDILYFSASGTGEHESGQRDQRLSTT